MKYLFLLFIPSFIIIAQEKSENNDSFSLSLSSQYSTAQISKGVNVSGTQGTFGNGVVLGHSNGLSFSYFNTQLSTGGTLNHAFSAGYSYDFTDFLYGDVDFSYTSYPDQSINAVAEFSKTLSLSLNADLQLFDLSLSYEKYLENGAPSYFGIGAMKIISSGNWGFIPSFDLTFISQEINYATSKFKQKSTNSQKSVSLSGISSVTIGCGVRYGLGKGFSFRFLPQLAFTPKQEIAVRSTQLTASIGIGYTTEF